MLPDERAHTLCRNERESVNDKLTSLRERCGEYFCAPHPIQPYERGSLDLKEED
jgi:hypothetical protein